MSLLQVKTTLAGRAAPTPDLPEDLLVRYRAARDNHRKIKARVDGIAAEETKLLGSIDEWAKQLESEKHQLNLLRQEKKRGADDLRTAHNALQVSNHQISGAGGSLNEVDNYLDALAAVETRRKKRNEKED